MNDSRRAVFLVSLVLALGCQSEQAKKSDTPTTEHPTEKPMAEQPTRVAGLEPGWELAPDAHYTASQTPGEVIIRATGENPSSNYETKLVMSMLRIWPPQYMLARHKTSDMGATVMTKFEAAASFKATDPIPAVRVTDVGGMHEVKVDQARD